MRLVPPGSTGFCFYFCLSGRAEVWLLSLRGGVMAFLGLLYFLLALYLPGEFYKLLKKRKIKQASTKASKQALAAVPEEPQGFRRYHTRMGPRAPSPVPQRRRRRARPSKMIAMEAKLDAIMHRMDKQDKKLHSAHSRYASGSFFPWKDGIFISMFPKLLSFRFLSSLCLPPYLLLVTTES